MSVYAGTFWVCRAVGFAWYANYDTVRRRFSAESLSYPSSVIRLLAYQLAEISNTTCRVARFAPAKQNRIIK